MCLPHYFTDRIKIRFIRVVRRECSTKIKRLELSSPIVQIILMCIVIHNVSRETSIKNSIIELILES